MEAFWLLTVLAALLFLQGTLVRRFGLRGLSYGRGFSKKAAFEGESVEMIETLSNRKPLPVPWLLAESRMSAHLRFSGDPVETVPPERGLEAYRREAFSMMPYTKVTRSRAVTLSKRGRYEAGSVSLTAGDLFGLAMQSLQVDTAAAISVYPRLLDAREMEWLSNRWQGDLLVKRWIAPDPYLIAGIREGQPGDARRDIHWAATARTGRLLVKVHDHTSAPKLFILLNVQRNERQWADLMEYEQGVIEKGISLVASLSVRILSEGLEVGFAANAPVGGDALPAMMLPASYAGRDADILEALARLRIVRVRNFHTLLDDISYVTGTDILILSAYDSPLIRERMEALRLRGNSTAFILLVENESTA